jgi:hypothetical protein
MATSTNTTNVTAQEIDQLEGHLENALLAWGMTPGSAQMESMIKMMTDDARWLLLQHEVLRP